MNREALGSRLGFILISAGCAIGIGNVWKFPWMVGQYGGAMFIILYLIFLFVMGVPVMTMEFSVGRGSKASPLMAFKKLEPKGTKWHIHGMVCYLGTIILMMFYTTVAGWMLNYFIKMVRGTFVGADTGFVDEQFNLMLSSPSQLIGFMVIVVVFCLFINSKNLNVGIESVSKVMMSALLLIMVVLAINSAMIEGSGPGLRFYLVPDINRFVEHGVFNVIVGAMNQAFFTLSLGIGSMAIFGSYVGEDRSLAGESVTISILDTFVAIVSGLIIFPACFAFGVDPGSGPALIFKTLPNIFAQMNGGRVWGSLFFLFLTFAAISTVIAVCESIVACSMEYFNWTRKRAALIVMIALLILSLPCALGFNILSGIQPLGEGSGIMDLEDFIVSNLLLPGGSIVFILFCTAKNGWGWENYLAECNAGKGAKIKGWMRWYLSVVLPLILVVILVIGVINTFK